MAEPTLDPRAARVNDNPQAGKQSASQSGSTDTVTIGCKMPHGLILDMTEPGKPSAKFVVRGNNSARLIGGFGITEGVPRDFWNAWLSRNKEMVFVKKGLIFAYGKSADVEAKATEKAAMPHGFEPMLDPLRGKVANIETAA